MAKKNDGNIILLIIGIVLFILIYPKIPFLHGNFAVVQQTVCDNSVISNWLLNGNSQDTKGANNGLSNNVIFDSISANFNGSSFINFPISASDNLIMQVKDNSAGDTTYYFLARVNSLNYINGVQDNTKQVIPLSSTFGLNRNISVKNIILFSNLTTSQMLNYYNNGSIRDVCYTTTQEVNVSCQDYYSSQSLVNSSGSLSVSGDYFPNCSSIWKEAQYSIYNNLCSKNFLYSSLCLASSNCYSEALSCSKDLKYSCYVLSGNTCVEKVDYASCVSNVSNTYSTSSICSSHVVASTTTSSVVPAQVETEESSFSSLANKEIFKIGTFSVTIVHILLLFVLVLGIAYLLGAFGKGGK